jgi:uncharacterized protein DUF4337
MDADVKTESSDKRLSNLVAVKAEGVDAWAEYQAARVKLHVDENGLAQLRLLETAGNFDRALAKQAAEYEADLKKYEARSKETRAKAESKERDYDRFNFRDDHRYVERIFLNRHSGGGGGDPGQCLLAALRRLGLRRDRRAVRNFRLHRAQFAAGMAGAAAGDVAKSPDFRPLL